MRTAMVERVPRALTGFDEVKIQGALRWFLMEECLRGRPYLHSRKSTSEVEAGGKLEAEAGGGQCSLTIG